MENNFDISIYNDEFFEWHLKHAREYSIKTMDWFVGQYKPKSVIDYGCGIGSYLESARNNGVEKIKGYDIGGEYAKKYTPKEVQPFIDYFDCTQEIKEEKYDCVISFETAEHIEPSGSDTFVSNIVNSVSDNGLILFTAAPPEQQGAGHINLQDKEFWIKLFLDKDCVLSEGDTKTISDEWTLLGAPKYICSSLLVFKKKQVKKTPLLSVLIPSVPERKEKLDKLISQLTEQDTSNEVEIIYNDSKKFDEGGITVGEKRNKLVQEANAKYLCFLDDDDSMSPNYVQALLSMCRQGYDVCTFRSMYKCDYYWALIDMDMSNPENEQANPLIITKRRAWHLCPVLSSIAKQHTFKNINDAEDWEWMERVLQNVVTHCHTNEILHQYNHSKKTSIVHNIKNK